MSEFSTALEGGEDEFFNEENIEIKDMPDGIPRPMYWRVLLYPYIPPKKTKGGILLPDESADAQEYFAFMARVVAFGPKAFKSRRLRDLEESEIFTFRGPAESHDSKGVDLDGEHEITQYADRYRDNDLIPKVGSWVIFQRHAGLRITYRGLKFFMCDDDAILALIDAPEGYKAYV